MEPRFSPLQDKAAEAVAKLIGVPQEDIETDVETDMEGTNFVVWSYKGRYGHYEADGTLAETTGK